MRDPGAAERGHDEHDVIEALGHGKAVMRQDLAQGIADREHVPAVSEIAIAVAEYGAAHVT